MNGGLSEISFADSSSFSERRPAVEKKPEPAPERKTRVTSSVLRRNNSIKKDMRPDIEQAVMMKLENLGVKPVSSQKAILNVLVLKQFSLNLLLLLLRIRAA